MRLYIIAILISVVFSNTHDDKYNNHHSNRVQDNQNNPRHEFSLEDERKNAYYAERQQQYQTRYNLLRNQNFDVQPLKLTGETHFVDGSENPDIEQQRAPEPNEQEQRESKPMLLTNERYGSDDTATTRYEPGEIEKEEDGYDRFNNKWKDFTGNNNKGDNHNDNLNRFDVAWKKFMYEQKQAKSDDASRAGLIAAHDNSNSNSTASSLPTTKKPFWQEWEWWVIGLSAGLILCSVTLFAALGSEHSKHY